MENPSYAEKNAALLHAVSACQCQNNVKVSRPTKNYVDVSRQFKHENVIKHEAVMPTYN